MTRNSLQEIAVPLQRSGIGLKDLQDSLIAEEAFKEARRLLEDPSSLPKIPPEADSAHVSGYHPAGDLSRYNRYREGFIWSDNPAGTISSDPQFEATISALRCQLLNVAQEALRSLESAFDLECGYFERTMGPTGDHSQWHIKRFVSKQDDKNWMDQHTDPSLVSIVIHDRPTQEGSYGLQYSKQDLSGKREWHSISRSGHGTAIVMVGSVLSQMLDIKPCRHRVIQQGDGHDRMAATLFLRPRPDAILQPIGRKLSKKPPVSFDVWCSRVARNYEKVKQKAKELTASQVSSVSAHEIIFEDDCTRLSLISCKPPLSGAEKYLGGERAPNGRIFAIPGHASRVLRIDATVEPPAIEAIGPVFHGQYKWLRSVLTQNRYILGIPCHADSMLCIDTQTEEISTIAWDGENPLAPKPGMKWKWHGGQILQDGCLYCIPQRAESVLKYDPATKSITFIGGPYEGRNKWYGGLVGADGALYGIPQCHDSILRIDPALQRTSLHGCFPGGYKWHGGVVAPNGSIFGIPAHADSILKIVCGLKPVISTFGGPLRTGDHRNDGKYKYLGGAVGQDRKIYLFPSDCDYMLQIDPENDVCQEVGPDLKTLERIRHNKWQNGFSTPDGSIYAIPLKATSVIRVQTRMGIDPLISTVGGPFDGLNHWEGGVMANDGSMYCMPLNHSRVLRIEHKKREAESSTRAIQKGSS